MLEDDQVDGQGAQVRADGHRGVRHFPPGGPPNAPCRRPGKARAAARAGPGRTVTGHLMGSAQLIAVPGAPGCFPRPGKSSDEGGIEELRLLRPGRRRSSATSARSSSTARPSSAIT
jgi:hypothetical protein